jgi:hypothetical protein
MTARHVFALLLVGALAGAGLGGCYKESMNSTIQANRANQFAIASGKKVAVLAFTGPSGSGLADLISIELLRHGVDVVERNVLDRVVAEVRRTEAGLYNNDLSDAEIIHQIGQITEADYVVFGDAAVIDPGTVHYYWRDIGSSAPKFQVGYSRISARAFSTATGEVVWWGTCETTVQGQKGDWVRIMDHLRISARRTVDSMMDPRINTYSNQANRSAIPPATGSLVPYGSLPVAAPPVAAPPVPAAQPVAQPTAAPAQPTRSKCTKDTECPGDLICVKGACAAP